MTYQTIDMRKMYGRFERENPLEILVFVDEDADRNSLTGNSFLGNFLVNTIRSEGDRATLVESGPESMDEHVAMLEAQKPYDAVFISFPEIYGVGIVERIKELLPKTPVYAMEKGYTENEEDRSLKDRFTTLGFNDVVDPLNPTQVRGILVELDPLRRSTENPSTPPSPTDQENIKNLLTMEPSPTY